MAEVPRPPGPTPDSPLAELPHGLIEELARPAGGPASIRPVEVARGRRRAFERAFDDGAVVDEIASRLLVLSSRD